tara:strand:+ start:316 stop:1200 length:885 start_codon:yes stop_codon:yes gene_type:complete
MPLINTIIQPVIKSAVQRVDGVIDIPLLLKTYSDATAGYSLRDIGANGGAVVRVRNDSTSEQDFTASEVSDGTLASFCNGVGVGDGFVSIWYDQSGNGNHATQTTNQYQPKIVDGGVVVKSNNQPTLSFGTSNTSYKLETPLGIFSNLNSVSFFMVVQLIQNLTATQAMLTLNPVFGLNAFGINVQSDGTNFSYNGILNNNSLMDHVPNLNENILYSALTEDPHFKGFANGSNILTTVLRDAAPTATGFIGTFTASILKFGGTFSELIVFDSGKANDRANIEENLANYYNITLS